MLENRNFTSASLIYFMLFGPDSDDVVSKDPQLGPSTHAPEAAPTAAERHRLSP